MIPTTTAPTILPTVVETYHPGTILKLYSYPPPIRPPKGDCRYKGSPRLPEVSNRYHKSIEERITIPSSTATSPDGVLTITLEKRFDSGGRNIAHVWLVQVQQQDSSSQTEAAAAAAVVYPSKLVAKIYDIVWYTESGLYDPSKARDLFVSREVESYHRFEPIQGTKVPRFYGHFVTPLSSQQQNRTVHVILMQYIPGDNLRHIILRDGGGAGVVCDAHRDAVHEAVLNFIVDIAHTFGVHLLDLYPRNVMVPDPLTNELHRESPFCAFPKCPLRLSEADWERLGLVMIDFDSVKFIEPLQYDDDDDSERREKEMDELRRGLTTWLECCSE